MSAFVIYAGPTSVEIAGDTAAIDESTGRIQILMPKVYIAQDRSFAMAGRGDVGLAGAALGEIRAQQLDLDLTLGWIRASLLPRLGEDRFDGLSFAVAGISPTRGPMIASFETMFPDQMMPRAPYTVHEEHGETCLVLSHLSTADLAGVVDLDRLGRSYDTEAVKILDHVRRAPLERQGVNLVLAAGQVQHYSITPAGASMKPLGYWPDMLGTVPNVGRKFVWTI